MAWIFICIAVELQLDLKNHYHKCCSKSMTSLAQQRLSQPFNHVILMSLFDIMLISFMDFWVQKHAYIENNLSKHTSKILLHVHCYCVNNHYHCSWNPLEGAWMPSSWKSQCLHRKTLQLQWILLLTNAPNETSFLPQQKDRKSNLKHERCMHKSLLSTIKSARVLPRNTHTHTHFTSLS